MGAHPSDLAGRIAYHQRVSRYIFGHHTACTHKSVGPQSDPTNDRRIGTDTHTSLQYRRLVFVLASYARAGIDHIGKYGTGTYKNIVFTDHSFVEADVVLHLHITPQPHFVGHKDILTQRATSTNHGTGHHVAKMPDFTARPDLCSFVNDRRRVGIKDGTHGLVF